VAVCDAYCAITERRSRRDPFRQSEAVSELRRHAGTQFDPACVRALFAALGTCGRMEPVRLQRPAHAA
jgi:HD-GYP domain-containing protein (c-di-GMP phosphodiesterase class II)